jgi:hypothetical protein
MRQLAPWDVDCRLAPTQCLVHFRPNKANRSLSLDVEVLDSARSGRPRWLDAIPLSLIDLVDNRLALAELGVTHSINLRAASDVLKTIPDLNGGYGTNMAVETVGFDSLPTLVRPETR